MSLQTLLSLQSLQTQVVAPVHIGGHMPYVN